MVVAEKALNVQKRQIKSNQQQNQSTKNKEEKSGNKGINDKTSCLYYSVIPNLLVMRSSGATEKKRHMCSNYLYHHHLDHENESMLCHFHLIFFSLT